MSRPSRAQPVRVLPELLGVWLVAELCNRCRPRSRYYCQAHRDLRPKRKPVPVVDAGEAQAAIRGRYDHDDGDDGGDA